MQRAWVDTAKERGIRPILRIKEAKETGGSMNTMPLKELIRLEFDNNNAEFARWFGTTPQQVSRWLKYGCIFYESGVYKQHGFKK